MAETQMLWKLVMQKKQTHAGPHLDPLLIHTLFSWAFHGFPGINIAPSTSPSPSTASFNLVAVEIPLFRPLVFTCHIIVQELGRILSRLEVHMPLQDKEGDAHNERNATWRAGWTKVRLNYPRTWSAIQETTPDTGWPPAWTFSPPSRRWLFLTPPWWACCFFHCFAGHPWGGRGWGRSEGLLMGSSKWPLRWTHIAHCYAPATEGRSLFTRMRIHCWKKSFRDKIFHCFLGFFFVALRCRRALGTSGKSLKQNSSCSCICQFIPSPCVNETLVTSLYHPFVTATQVLIGSQHCPRGSSMWIRHSLSHGPYQPPQLDLSATRQWQGRIWSRPYAFYLLNAQGGVDPSLKERHGSQASYLVSTYQQWSMDGNFPKMIQQLVLDAAVWRLD